ncbi:MAG: 1-acyl-sn-glycerol-3-phosphate acyltransferase [Muribaculaceae bacterium]|nr:1-acyl-sn-glycerol-3-phosphate acyltransferase [Muribaculaceae bacterium]
MMTKLALGIYEFMSKHRVATLISFVAVTAVLVSLVLKLSFKENISDFMSLEGRQQESMEVFRDISGAGKIVAIFKADAPGPVSADTLTRAIDYFKEVVEKEDVNNQIINLTTQVDYDKVYDLADYVYVNIPYFLTEQDYHRADSILDDVKNIERRLDEDKQLLMFPTSGVVTENLQRDPLGLFLPVLEQLQSGVPSSDNIELYEGYIFTKDMSRAMVLMESPYGSSETKNNARLVALLDSIAMKVSEACPGVTIDYIGGPVIAVTNSTQIKSDSLLSSVLAVVLIVLLLIMVFRKPWNILLIFISVGWGWLFAMAIMSMVHDSVSLIVVGMSSIILGIAVNYPLHLLAHTAHTASMRQVLREIISPLVIGNITTVGAFMALVPLKATALVDLGIFSALILAGTILFVIIYLPHAATHASRPKGGVAVGWLDRLSSVRLENKRWVVVGVLLLTVVMGYFSVHTQFDSDMSHINYMTESQHADMVYFNELANNKTDDIEPIYVVSTGPTLDSALNKCFKFKSIADSISNTYHGVKHVSCLRFLSSASQQKERLERWRGFVNRHRALLTDTLADLAVKHGFSKDAFEPFSDILTAEYNQRPSSFFDVLRDLNMRHLSIDSVNSRYRVVDVLYTPRDAVKNVENLISQSTDNHYCFDARSLNGAIAEGLSDNFNYIGWACGLIVFFFLWASFASIELAMLSFLPMAISWVWILGIMGVTGIQFNIVNIILATFIFGQGDDYTIFITEGCCYEYAYRRKMLASYKSSILVSALIMFIGIGSLILARHPALYSLAEVTIVGMLSVVLMACLFPPLVFNWIVKSRGHYRKRPLRLGPVMRTWFCGVWWITQLVCGYILGFLLIILCRHNKKTEMLFRRFVSWSHRLDLRLMPGVKFTMHNPHGQTLEKPCVIVCNHQSMLDPMYLMAWSPKILIVANERSSLNPVVRIMFRWLGFYTIRQSNFTAWKDSSLERDMEIFRRYVDRGFSIAFFPEGMRNPESSILRCHKGPFYLANKLGIDVLPVYLHGVNHLMPIRSFACYSGNINMLIGERITPQSTLWSDSYGVMAHNVHRLMVSQYKLMCDRYETADYFASLVIDRYRYKGVELLREVKGNLRKNNNYTSLVDQKQSQLVIIINSGYGEMPLLMALVHPDVNVIAVESDHDRLTVAKYAAEGLVDNLEYKSSLDNYDTLNALVYQL